MRRSQNATKRHPLAEPTKCEQQTASELDQIFDKYADEVYLDGDLSVAVDFAGFMDLGRDFGLSELITIGKLKKLFSKQTARSGGILLDRDQFGEAVTAAISSSLDACEARGLPISQGVEILEASYPALWDSALSFEQLISSLDNYD